ncbi:CPBP family intramembrane metalloprotease [Undibacterium sp. CY18W]|uniref:CPBP family intramembrane metalloprotease n=1 Tax=Undibacterium hunanense TaxID=2762292 RepID=A0ABR6ZXL6_9BURK|nr:CPBP family glutamic-type intramembrane protease [Undibacterium hunanense]MBC3920310.1 CPBP family intramembrane metalloprotease [Undibacterium hunanense]
MHLQFLTYSTFKPMKFFEYVKRESGDFKRFLVHPQRRKPNTESLTAIGARLLFLLALTLLFGIFISVLSTEFFMDWAGAESKMDMKAKYLPTRELLMVILFAPVMEELIFRAGLRKAKYSLFVCPPLLALALLAHKVALVLAIVICAIAIIDFFVRKRADVEAKTALKFARARSYLLRFPWIFWFYSLCFGFVHMSNYTVSGTPGLLMIVIVAPQFFAGLAVGYLRLRNGILSGMILHASYNCVLVAISMAAR